MLEAGNNFVWFVLGQLRQDRWEVVLCSGGKAYSQVKTSLPNRSALRASELLSPRGKGLLW